MSMHSRRSSSSSQGRSRRESAAGLSRQASVARLASMGRRDSCTTAGPGRTGALAAAVAFRRKVSSVLVVKESKAKEYWRKVRLWVPVISVLARTVKRLAHAAITDPASPFYSGEHVEEETTPSCVDKDHYMFFDRSFFKANRQMRMSQEGVRILTKPPDERSPTEIQFIMTGLRAVSTIAELPVRMQKNLAKFGYFECYESKRMILKQGHRPEAFYFILYGKVAEAVKDDVTGFAKVVCHLQRGESFGELAIINRTVRKSSVLTQSYTELLALSDTDYQQIFLIGGSISTKDPDLDRFLSSLSCLRGWPVHKIADDADPQNVSFGYFKRKCVMTKDSNVSDWLIVVKSGSVSVLKKLAKVKATVSRRTGQYTCTAGTSRYLSFVTHSKDYARWLHSHSICLPSPLSVSEDEEDASDVSDSGLRAGRGDRDAELSAANQEGDFSSHCDDVAIQAVKCVMRPHTSHVGSRKDVRCPRNSWSAKDAGPKTAKLSPAFKTPNLKTTKILFYPESTPVDTSDRQATTMRAGGINTCNKADQKTREITADANPQFVLVHTLTKGDVFGLASIVFPDQPSLCLVSNGAECLLIQKRFYLDNCSPVLMRRLRVEVSPYPSEMKLQQDLVNRINWDAYKNVVRRQVNENKQINRTPVFFRRTMSATC